MQNLKTYISYENLFFCCKNLKLENYPLLPCFSVKFSIPHEKSISSRCSLDLMRSFFLHLLFHFGGAKHCRNDFPQESVSACVCDFGLNMLGRLGQVGSWWTHAASLDFSIQ